MKLKSNQKRIEETIAFVGLFSVFCLILAVFTGSKTFTILSLVFFIVFLVSDFFLEKRRNKRSCVSMKKIKLNVCKLCGEYLINENKALEHLNKKHKKELLKNIETINMKINPEELLGDAEKELWNWLGKLEKLIILGIVSLTILVILIKLFG